MLTYARHRWQRWRRALEHPEPPRNVLITLRSGDTVGPLPLRYNGLCRHNQHQWLAIASTTISPDMAGFSVESMPVNADLAFVFLPDDLLDQLLQCPNNLLRARRRARRSLAAEKACE